MWTKGNPKGETRGKLAREILEYLCVGLIISLFMFAFLYFSSISIAENYLYRQGISIDEMEEVTLHVWIRSVCFFASVVVFISLFLFLFGQKITYLVSIIRGVQTLNQNQMDYIIPLEGNDELTQLAQTINDFSKAQKELHKKEKELKAEKEELIRSLSHDIRTPLTSIMSYSEYIKSRADLTKEDMESYIGLIQSKAEQINILTDQLLGKKNKHPERIENGKLLMEQLVSEWEEVLEERFRCSIDLENCHPFRGIFAVSDLQRIFDNLASNVEKYADSKSEVKLQIKKEGDQLIIIQRNGCNMEAIPQVESHKIGLASIRQIAQDYGGGVNIIQKDEMFEIQIRLQVLSSV